MNGLINCSVSISTLYTKQIKNEGIFYKENKRENQAKAKLQKANLLVSASEDEPTGEPVTVTDVDAVSGATVSSKAVATTINNGYFFLKEAVLK